MTFLKFICKMCIVISLFVGFECLDGSFWFNSDSTGWVQHLFWCDDRSRINYQV